MGRLMRTLPRTRCDAACLALLVLSVPLPATAQATGPPTGSEAVSGTWLARNFRNPRGQLVTVVLDLTAHEGSISGLLRVEFPTGSSAAPSVPVWGVVRAESLFLADSERVPLVAVRVEERRLIGRMAGAQGRLNRGVPNLTKLADSRPMTFERQ